MNIYEIEINGFLWWVAAEDQEQATNILVEELETREISDEEIDEALEELHLIKVDPIDAETMDIVDEYGDSMYTLWDMFLRYEGVGEAGLLHTDFSMEEDDSFYIDEDTYMDLSYPWDGDENF